MDDTSQINVICASGSVGRASPCQGEGRGFESRLALLFSGCGSVWLERLIWVQEAAGSSPVTPMIQKSRL